MLSWEQRPFEIAYSLNPAYCTLVLHSAINGFINENQDDLGMPYPLIFLILPLIIYQPIRDALPNNTAIRLTQWLKDNSQVQIWFAKRIEQLVPYTKETVLFAMQHQVIAIDKNGTFYLTKKRLNIKNELNWSDDVIANICIKKAHFLGKWFAVTGDETTIFRIMGIRP